MNKGLSTRSGHGLNPWSVIKNDIFDVFDRLTQDLDMPLAAGTQQFVPKIEVKDTGTAYQVCAEVPGMDEKDINLTLKDNHLVIEGERKNETKEEDRKKGVFRSEISYGRFYRAIPLYDDVDADKVTAKYANGVLTIDVQKVPLKEEKVRKIEINGGKAEETRH